MGCDAQKPKTSTITGNISIHAPIVGCDVQPYKITDVGVQISIHAPIVGCDLTDRDYVISVTDFNPRTHRGVRRQNRIRPYRRDKFQSTHPSWGATVRLKILPFRLNHFNPRTHRGVRHRKMTETQAKMMISIHAPIVGCDRLLYGIGCQAHYFNPRTHRGVRHVIHLRRHFNSDISIHAPIVGCDLLAQLSRTAQALFQSTHPSWGATQQAQKQEAQEQFQSTHPSWGATTASAEARSARAISIHAPIVGCDLIAIAVHYRYMHFNPRTHRGVRPISKLDKKHLKQFQSTHPSWGATLALSI